MNLKVPKKVGFLAIILSAKGLITWNLLLVFFTPCVFVEMILKIIFTNFSSRDLQNNGMDLRKTMTIHAKLLFFGKILFKQMLQSVGTIYRVNFAVVP